VVSVLSGEVGIGSDVKCAVVMSLVVKLLSC
jgi:hypothetical protein